MLTRIRLAVFCAIGLVLWFPIIWVAIALDRFRRRFGR